MWIHQKWGKDIKPSTYHVPSLLQIIEDAPNVFFSARNDGRYSWGQWVGPVQAEIDGFIWK